MLSLDEIIKYALEEDRAFEDVTTAYVVPEGKRARGRALAKSRGVMAGGWVAEKVFSAVDPGLVFRQYKKEGEEFLPGEVLFTVEGEASSILKGERVALNFLQRLCGIASLTREFVRAVEGTGVKIMDTRKTTPLLRLLEKYAVKMGGGENHRFDLREMVLIKENHIVLAGSLREAIRRAKKSGKFVEVEVKSLEELREALSCGPDRIMLDNFSPEEIRRAVGLVRGRVELEASGGVNLENVREIAETGVDLISIGGLTHSFRSSDISLLVEVL